MQLLPNYCAILALVPGHSMVTKSVNVDFRFTGFMDCKLIQQPGTTVVRPRGPCCGVQLRDACLMWSVVLWLVTLGC